MAPELVAASVGDANVEVCVAIVLAMATCIAMLAPARVGEASA